MKYIRRYDIDLDPFIELRKRLEEIRALKATKNKKQKKIQRRFVSVNSMYPINRHAGCKYLSAEGLAYKDYIHEVLGGLDEFFRFPRFRTDAYESTYVFYMTYDMMFTKQGDFRDVDVTNMFKAAEDAVFEHLLESDKRVVSIHGYKRVTKTNPKLIVLLSPAKEGDSIHHAGFDVSPVELENDAGLLQGGPA